MGMRTLVQFIEKMPGRRRNHEAESTHQGKGRPELPCLQQSTVSDVGRSSQRSLASLARPDRKRPKLGQGAGYRAGENPALWRGHLDHLLPAKSKVRKVEHHPALPYGRIGAFMADLLRREGTTAKALRFLILTAARTDEVRHEVERN
jgi:hypothetical protein